MAAGRPWLLDILWPIFLMIGIERVRIVPGPNPFTTLDFTWYPWSHSLVMSIVWGVLAAAIYRASTRDRRGATIVGLLVVSHWVLDLIVHQPDLPLAPGLVTRLGLGLWNFPTATLVVEGALFAAGLGIYLRVTRARDLRGVIGLVVARDLHPRNLRGEHPRSAASVRWRDCAGGPGVRSGDRAVGPVGRPASRAAPETAA